MAKNPENAKVWFMVGQVYVGLGNFLGADSAFKKAEQLYPGYAEDISGEREVAWVEAFNAGLAQMDKKNTDEAIKQLELAELMYPHRPEGKMNLGALTLRKTKPTRHENIRGGDRFDQRPAQGKAQARRRRELEALRRYGQPEHRANPRCCGRRAVPG
jgi:tetratricopeptide (TPR) repeat protein